MKKTFVTFALMCFYAPLAVMACSTSSSSGSGGSVSSIDPTKQASTLSDADKTQYCKDTVAYYTTQVSATDTKKVSCVSEALSSVVQGGALPKTDAEYQSKCKAAYQDCLNKPVDKGDAGATTKDECATAAKDLATCTATVGELNQCTQDTVAATKAAYATLATTCDTVLLDGGGVAKVTDAQPASCKALEAKCPMIAK